VQLHRTLVNTYYLKWRGDIYVGIGVPLPATTFEMTTCSNSIGGLRILAQGNLFGSRDTDGADMDISAHGHLLAVVRCPLPTAKGKITRSLKDSYSGIRQ